MKLQRWIIFDYLLNKGEWCTSKDVAELEAKHAQLIKNVEFVIEHIPDGVYWAAGIKDLLLGAVCKAKGEVMP